MKRRPGRPGEPVRRSEADAEPSARPEAERPPGEPGLKNRNLQDKMDQFIPGIPWEEYEKLREP